MDCLSPSVKQNSCSFSRTNLANKHAKVKDDDEVCSIVSITNLLYHEIGNISRKLKETIRCPRVDIIERLLFSIMWSFNLLSQRVDVHHGATPGNNNLRINA